jgi:DNA-binding GntR family transcriptional regulator
MAKPPTTRMEMAYRDLKDRIIRLHMKPGLAFSESEIASALGLSKTPVREALARLQLEGWVTIVARSGYFVAPVTLKDARDVLAVAVLLEGEAAGLAARLGPDVSDLVALNKRADNARAKRDIVAYLRHVHSLSVGIADLSGNHRLALVTGQMHDHVERLLHLAFSIVPDLSLEGHGEVLDAIARTDPAAATESSRSRATERQRAVLDALLASDVIMSANVTPGRTARGA